MNARAANLYRRVDLESAPKHDVLGRLFDRFAVDVASAKKAIAAKDIIGKAAAIDHGLRIVSELQAALDPSLAPELCKNLYSLYEFVATQLCMANLSLDHKRLDEASRIMNELSTAFREVTR
ncbi:MAG: flagellar export chaperone FliS [Kofleriaceae bacterium]